MEYISLITILGLSMLTDIWYKKIPNLLIITAIIIGIVMNIYTSGGIGVVNSLVGFFCGVALLVIPFALGGFGAGDVKLLGAIGAIKGAKFAYYAFLYSALWGGLCAIILLVYHKKMFNILKWIGSTLVHFVLFVITKGRHPLKFDKLQSTKLSIPYAIPVFLGTITILLLGVV